MSREKAKKIKILPDNAILLKDRIVLAREKIGLTQDEMARKIGVHLTTYHKYEKGVTIPDANSLSEIARLSNSDPGWILSGDHAESFNIDNDEFAYVPVADAKASGGEGFVVHSDQIVDHLAFKKDWVKIELGVNPKNLMLFYAIGDSMEPNIRPNDLLLVDMSGREIKNDAIYCFSEDGELKVKRFQKIGDRVVVKSDNPAYERYEISGNNKLNLVGRVVWIGRRV